MQSSPTASGSVSCCVASASGRDASGATAGIPESNVERDESAVSAGVASDSPTHPATANTAPAGKTAILDGCRLAALPHPSWLIDTSVFRASAPLIEVGRWHCAVARTLLIADSGNLRTKNRTDQPIIGRTAWRTYQTSASKRIKPCASGHSHDRRISLGKAHHPHALPGDLLHHGIRVVDAVAWSTESRSPGSGNMLANEFPWFALS
jgi:hypothetical protein